MTKHYLTLAAAALAVLLAACGDDDNGEVLPDGGPEDAARVRVVHAAPDAPAVDVFIRGDDQPIVEDLSFGEASPFVGLEPGTVQFEVRPAGADPDEAPIFTTDLLELERDEQITAVAAGFLEGTGEEAFRVIPIVEEFDAAEENQAVVRLVNASPDAPPISIDVDGDGEPDTTIDRFGTSAAEGIQVPAGQPIRINVFAGDPPERVSSFTLASIPEGAEVLVIATGRFTDRLPREQDGFSVLTVAETGPPGVIRQDPVLFALHGVPDAPAVDAFVGDQQVVENLGFGEIAGPLQIQPGRVDLTLVPAGAGPGGEPQATVRTDELEAGQRYLVVAGGYLTPQGEQRELELITVMDEFDLAVADAAQLGAVHAVADAPAVDISTIEDNLLAVPVLVEDLNFGEASGPIQVPAAELEVGIAPTGERSPLASFDVATQEGQRAFVVAIGELELTGNHNALAVVAVDTSMFPWRAAALGAP